MTEMCGCPGIVGLHERDEWCPREFPLGGFCSCGQPYGSLHSCPERTRAVTPADQALETLALIAEHSLELTQRVEGGVIAWNAPWHQPRIGMAGPTIGDAVRACVQRIKER